MQIYKPPLPIPEISKLTGPIIFLAGSIEQGKAVKWQNRVCTWLFDQKCTILNPRRDFWDPTWDQSTDNQEFVDQVNWELHGQDIADLIIMYFDPETKSPITLMELGLYAESKDIWICCPKGFWRKGNVDIVANRYGLRVHEDLAEMFSEFKQEFFASVV